MLGSAVYWLRSSSPFYDLPISAFKNVSDINLNGTIATEVLQVEFATEPPTTVQSAEPVPTFSVAMLDYYGNVAVSELGACSVTTPNRTEELVLSSIAVNETNNGGTNSGAPDVGAGDDSSLAPSPEEAPALPTNGTDIVNVRPLGSEVGVAKGEAVFSQLEVTGTIGESYELNVDCKPNTLGRSRFLNLSSTSLPSLALPVYVAPCKPGKEPKSTGDGSICVECPFNTFNTDGLQCKPCPEGALCAGRWLV